MKKVTQRGFTLIELLVVIAIIGLLAAVVLAAVGSARTKGVDAAVKSQLDSAKGQAELYYSTNNTYGASGALCTATQSNYGLASILANVAKDVSGVSVGTAQAVADATHVACDSSATSWVVEAPITGTNNAWCVDSSGNSKAESNTWAAAAATVCP
jgi:prepilin-type N-terminal cleavage/methylation domain-containing protein